MYLALGKLYRQAVAVVQPSDNQRLYKHFGSFHWDQRLNSAYPVYVEITCLAYIWHVFFHRQLTIRIYAKTLYAGPFHNNVTISIIPREEMDFFLGLKWVYSLGRNRFRPGEEMDFFSNKKKSSSCAISWEEHQFPRKKSSSSGELAKKKGKKKWASRSILYIKTYLNKNHTARSIFENKP